MFVYKMQIFYGKPYKNIDVTNICLEKLTNNNILRIPCNDHERAKYFTDPLDGVLKSIFILKDNIITEYHDNVIIKINLIDNTIDNTITILNDYDVNNKISAIHSKLQLKYGSFNDELPEQKMAVRYLTGNEKVLEIGSNIGRNSLIIAYILGEKNNNNFVTLESDIDIANQLKENRDLNNFNFHIENSALSKRKLIQRDWDTIVSDVLLDGYKTVNTITYEELSNKYNINFDTLVLDCEGAFYYILMDMPEILNNINLIIMENDYYYISNKQFIDNVLIQHNFYVDYSEGNGWGPCSSNFYEVWKK